MRKPKVNRGLWLTVIMLGILLLNPQSFGAKPHQCGVLPHIRIPVPGSDAEKEYLGLTGGEFFTIPQIEARVVIIEIFSMYCPYCQREAPEVNRLYTLIESDPGLKGRIKLIGLGAGNSRFEVEMFKKKYDVPFPLFHDKDFAFHQRFGEARTPFFIGVKINADETHQVLYSKLGGFGEAEEFLHLIANLSGLQGGGQ
jgi:peroxiredoxin